MMLRPAIHGPLNRRAFTLVEIMVVVVVIGLLAALALPAFARVQRSAKIARVVNDFRILSQAFELYNGQNGVWPNNAGAGVVPSLPYPMNDDFRVASWSAITTVGGKWNWDNSLNSGGFAGVSISSVAESPLTDDDTILTDIDKRLDDGDLTTGEFVKVSTNRVTYVLAR